MSDPALRWLKLDKYAIDDLAVEHLLSPHDCWTLLTVARRARWETHELTTTLAELAEWTRLARNTIQIPLRRLVDRELLGVAEPFSRGGQGTLGVVVYRRLFLPNATQSKRERVDDARWLRGPCAVLVQNRASVPHELAISGPPLGREAERDRGIDVCALHGLEDCFQPECEQTLRNPDAAENALRVVFDARAV